MNSTEQREYAEPGLTITIGRDYYTQRKFYIWWTCYGYEAKGRGWRKPFPWTRFFKREPRK